MTLGPAPKDLLCCSSGGCKRPLVARGLCSTHYQAAYRSQSLPDLKERPKKVAVKTFVSPEVESQIRLHSRKTGQTRSEILRAALERYLKESTFLPAT